MLTCRVWWQGQLRGEGHVELVVVPERDVRDDLQRVVRILAIVEVVVLDNHLMERGRARHDQLECHILNLYLTPLIICGLHYYGLGRFLTPRVLKVLAGHHERLSRWTRYILYEPCHIKSQWDATHRYN